MHGYIPDIPYAICSFNRSPRWYKTIQNNALGDASPHHSRSNQSLSNVQKLSPAKCKLQNSLATMNSMLLHESLSYYALSDLNLLPRHVTSHISHPARDFLGDLYFFPWDLATTILEHASSQNGAFMSLILTTMSTFQCLSSSRSFFSAVLSFSAYLS